MQSLTRLWSTIPDHSLLPVKLTPAYHPGFLKENINFTHSKDFVVVITFVYII